MLRYPKNKIKAEPVLIYRLCNGKPNNPDTFSASFSPSLLKDQKNKAVIG